MKTNTNLSFIRAQKTKRPDAQHIAEQVQKANKNYLSLMGRIEPLQIVTR